MASVALFVVGMLMGACTVTAYACCRVASMSEDRLPREKQGSKRTGGAVHAKARSRPSSGTA